MDPGSMLGAVIVLAVVGLALYLLFTYVPMEPIVATVIKIVVVLFAIIYLLRLVGIVPRFG